jgi:hypothetical protein
LPTRRTYDLLFLLVVAPIGAMVLIVALMAFGVPPRLVFAPGFAVIALLHRAGLPAPRPLGVLATGAAWWLLVVIAGFASTRLAARVRFRA